VERRQTSRLGRRPHSEGDSSGDLRPAPRRPPANAPSPVASPTREARPARLSEVPGDTPTHAVRHPPIRTGRALHDLSRPRREGESGRAPPRSKYNRERELDRRRLDARRHGPTTQRLTPAQDVAAHSQSERASSREGRNTVTLPAGPAVEKLPGQQRAEPGHRQAVTCSTSWRYELWKSGKEAVSSTLSSPAGAGQRRHVGHGLQDLRPWVAARDRATRAQSLYSL